MLARLRSAGSEEAQPLFGVDPGDATTQLTANRVDLRGGMMPSHASIGR